MLILNTPALTKFARKHRGAFVPLARWVELTEEAEWKSIPDVRAVFPSADGVPVRVEKAQVISATVFNIKAYRLITVIDFGGAVVTVRECLTHAEYDRNLWKNRL